MKKYIFMALLLLVAFLPGKALAYSLDDYNVTNLEAALTEEDIDHDLSKYKETDDQAVIYLFRGNGCHFCQDFLTYLNSIVGEYGDKFKVVSFEVWKDATNASLLEATADLFDQKEYGVPFIIIGGKYFPGYSESFNKDIIEAIEKEYEADEKYDLIKELNNAPAKDTATTSAGTENNTSVIILCNFAFNILAVGAIMIYCNMQNKKIMDKISEIKKK